MFPDDEALVQEEFERNLPFAESVAHSAADPDDPKSSLGIKTKPFYIKSDDPYKEGMPGANFTFEYSYGDPQPVQVLAKRASARDGQVPDQRRRDAERLDDGVDRAASATSPRPSTTTSCAAWSPAPSPVTRSRSGSRAAARRASRSPTQAVSETGSRMLVVAAEDYTGASPVQTPGPHYLQLLPRRAGRERDRRRRLRRRRARPHGAGPLGVLSHYDGVIWYTGDDVVTRKAGGAGGNADRLALDEMLEMRAYMDEGGRVLYTGKRAGKQYTGAGVGTQLYDPKNEGACSRPATPRGTRGAACCCAARRWAAT